MKRQQLSKITIALALAMIGIIVTGQKSAHALSLLGAQVTGEFIVNNGSTNFFDPENGKVPDFTYGNSLNVPGNGTNMVPISNTLTEFGYQGALDLFTANFTGAGMVTVFATGVPFTNVNMNFTSPGFTGLQFASVGGPNNCSFANSTIACHVTLGAGFTSTYAFTAQTPEPTSLTLLGLGLAGLVARYRKRA